MQKRRRNIVRPNWQEQIKSLEEEAERCPPGPRRDEFLRRKRDLESAAQMANWLASPELRKPD